VSLRERLERVKEAYEGVPSPTERALTAERDSLSRMADAQRDAYLQLLLKCIVGLIYRDRPLRDAGRGERYDQELREYGWDWPSTAHSMIGKKRMENIRYLVEQILAYRVPGDFIETGVWRGGACIFMRGILKAHGVEGRNVWVADSFAGLPPPDEEKFPADKGDSFHTFKELAVTLDDVKENFARYDLLDDRVKFLVGWFKDTLPSAPIDRLALLRLDGDMYESTMEAIEPLYPKLSIGGYVIVDDYHVVAGCKQAITDYRDKHGITDPIVEIDGVGVWWKKTK
jgi:O-methyltransferase